MTPTISRPRQLLAFVSSIALLAVIFLVVPTARAVNSDVRFSADPTERLTVLTISTSRGMLTRLSFRATTTVAASAPRAALGHRVGTLELISQTTHQIALRMPARRSNAMTLAQDGDLRVVLRPGAQHMLSVYGLPASTAKVSIQFSGAGRGVIAPTARRCPGRVTTKVFVDRANAGHATLSDSVRCGRAQ